MNSQTAQYPVAATDKNSTYQVAAAKIDGEFPKLGERLWREAIPASKNRPFQPGEYVRVVSFSRRGEAQAVSESEPDGGCYNISRHAWQSGLFRRE